MTRSMTTVERYIELRSRLQELDAMAEHVPPAVLAERLVAIVSKHMEGMGSPVKIEGIRERVGKIAKLESHGLKPADLKIRADFLPTERTPAHAHPGEEPITVEISQGAPVDEEPPLPEEPVSTKPGPPAIVRDELPVEDTPEDVSQDTTQPVEEAGEPEKPCKECGVTKPLSEFPRNPTYKDNHTNVCKPCTKARRKKGNPAKNGSSGQTAASLATPAEETRGATATAKLCSVCGPEAGPKPLRDFPVTTKSPDGHTDTCMPCAKEIERLDRQVSYDPAKVVRLPGGIIVPPPEKEPEPRVEAPVRYCANDKDCVAYPQLDEPTRMHPSNLDDVCFPCQEVRRKFGRTGARVPAR